MDLFTDNDGITKQVTLANVSVQMSRPSVDIVGVTFLLPGSMIAVSEYDSIRDALLQHGQVVLSFFINVLTTKHRVVAEHVRGVFDDFCNKSSHPGSPFDTYNIVGHSVGAKVALLVACWADCHRVKIVLSLDPIDMNPPEFTNDGPLSLGSAEAAIHITWARAGGWGIRKSQNPEAVYKTDPSVVKSFTKFPHAGHMSYTDQGGGWPGMLMPSPGATRKGNAVAHDGTLALVTRIIGQRIVSTVDDERQSSAPRVDATAAAGPGLAYA